MKKRLLSLALTLAISLSLLPTAALAIDTGKITWIGNAADYPGLEQTMYSKGYAVVTRKGIEGVIDPQGNTKVSFQYNNIQESGPGAFYVQNANSDLWGAVSLDGRQIIPEIYQKVSYANGYYTAGKEDGKSALLDVNGKVLTPFQYDEIKAAAEEKTSIAKRGGISVILDGQGKELCAMPAGYSIERYLGEGNYEVKEASSGAFGTVSATGQQLLPCKYEMIREFAGGVSVARPAGMSGDAGIFESLVNPQGQVVTGDVYRNYVDSADDFLPKTGIIYAYPEFGKSSAYYDKTGKAVISNIQKGSPFHNDFAAAAIDGKWYTIDQKGNKLGAIPATTYSYELPTYDPEYGDLIPIATDFSNLGFVDRSGKIVIPIIHMVTNPNNVQVAVDPVTGYFILIKMDTNTVAIYDKTGKVIVPGDKYGVSFYATGNQVHVPVDGCLIVAGYDPVTKQREIEKSGVIDMAGNLIIPCQYKYATILGGGLFRVSDDRGKDIVVNRKNEIVVPEQKNSINNEIVFVIRDGKVGWLTADGLSQTGPQAAAPNASKVLVNGKAVAFDAYTISQNNYFKLRDLATALNGTDKQFSVGWDGKNNAITVTSGSPYSPVGGELAPGDGTAKTAVQSTSKLTVNGVQPPMAAYTINQNNYFKLRDLMQVLDVYVGWDGATSTITLDTAKTYDGKEAAGATPVEAGKIKTDRPTAALTSLTEPEEGKSYFISFGKDGKQLLVPQDGSSAAGTAAVMSKTQGEKFYIAQESAMFCTIQSVQTGLYLTWPSDPKEPLTFQPQTNDYSQRFSFAEYTQMPHPNARALLSPDFGRGDENAALQSDGRLTMVPGRGAPDFYILTDAG